MRGMSEGCIGVMRSVNAYDVVVVGARQAGLSAAYALAKAGLDRERYVVLDANPGPGGAWRHRWPSLTLGAAHRVHPLPGLDLPESDPAEPASAVVGRYFGVSPDGDGSRLRQAAIFHPRGLSGHLYWWAIKPFHRFVFGPMQLGVKDEAERIAREKSGAAVHPAV